MAELNGDTETEPDSPRWRLIGLGLACVTGSTLAFEILLTRIFSVVLWYHYGFMAISLALLGLGLAGIFVYLYPERFPRSTAGHTAAVAAIGFALTTVASIVALHWIVSTPSHQPLGAGWRSVVFVLSGVPFFFAGLAVAIPISRFTDRIGVLYSADLLGAAVGVLVVIPLITALGGFYAVIACAAVAGLGGVWFAAAAGSRRTIAFAALVAALCTLGVPWTIARDSFDIRFSKRGKPEDNRIAEGWNAFSRVGVYEQRRRRAQPFGWTLGQGAPDQEADPHWIVIDGGAGTPLIRFDGDLEKLRYLMYDVTSLGYQVRPQQSALVIGAGGGRDILTAKQFGVESIHAVEINPLVADFVRNEFREWSGSPYDLPGVTFTVLDGRSYVAQSERRFDHIQISAVDTTAAMAAGALSLAEDSLYTVEAFEDYHDHLSETGLLSVTRMWTQTAQMIALRSADLVIEAWGNRGHTRPQDHLVIIAPPAGKRGAWGTMLVSRKPFTEAELARIEATVEKLGFSFLYAPNRPNPAAFEALLGPERAEFFLEYPFDVRAVTDDRPFFFYFTKPFQRAINTTKYPELENIQWLGRQAPKILMQAFGLVTTLVFLFALVVPVAIGRLRLATTRGAGSGLLYFGAIGLGFILVELALIQRYTVVLGQPLYAFAGILGTVLVFSGLGSYVSQSIDESRLQNAASGVLGALFGLIVLHALFAPPLLEQAMRADLPWRLAATVATIGPLGFLMGMPLPLGMRLLERDAPQALAWAWGINGSLSVLGTVLAMVLSIFWGITYTMLAGAALYAGAVATTRRGSRQARH